MKVQDVVDHVEEQDDWVTYRSVVLAFGEKLVQNAIAAKLIRFMMGYVGPVREPQPLLHERQLTLDQLMAQPISVKLADAATMMENS